MKLQTKAVSGLSPLPFTRLTHKRLQNLTLVRTTSPAPSLGRLREAHTLTVLRTLSPEFNLAQSALLPEARTLRHGSRPRAAALPWRRPWNAEGAAAPPGARPRPPPHSFRARPTPPHSPPRWGPAERGGQGSARSPAAEPGSTRHRSATTTARPWCPPAPPLRHRLPAPPRPGHGSPAPLPPSGGEAGGQPDALCEGGRPEAGLGVTLGREV